MHPYLLADGDVFLILFRKVIFLDNIKIWYNIRYKKYNKHKLFSALSDIVLNNY